MFRDFKLSKTQLLHFFPACEALRCRRWRDFSNLAGGQSLLSRLATVVLAIMMTMMVTMLVLMTVMMSVTLMMSVTVTMPVLMTVMMSVRVSSRVHLLLPELRSLLSLLRPRRVPLVLPVLPLLLSISPLDHAEPLHHALDERALVHAAVRQLVDPVPVLLAVLDLAEVARPICVKNRPSRRVRSIPVHRRVQLL